METLRFELKEAGLDRLRLRSVTSTLASVAHYATNHGARPFGELEMDRLSRAGPPKNKNDIYLVLVVIRAPKIRPWMWSDRERRFVPIHQVEAQYLIGSANNDMRPKNDEWETTLLDGAEELPSYETFVFAPAVPKAENPPTEDAKDTPFITPR